jgi:hypothetical protein
VSVPLERSINRPVPPPFSRAKFVLESSINMTSKPQTPESNNSQLSIETDWSSDTDFSEYLDIDALLEGSILESTLDLEQPCLQMHSVDDETQSPAEDIQLRASSTSLAGTSAPAPRSTDSATAQRSETFVQACPETDRAIGEGAEGKPRPLTEAEKEIKV